MHFICYLLRLLLFPPIYSTHKFIGPDWIIADIAYRLPTTVQQQQSSPFPPTDKYLSIETLFRSACTYCQSTPMVTNEPNPPSTTTKNNNRRKKKERFIPEFLYCNFPNDHAISGVIFYWGLLFHFRLLLSWFYFVLTSDLKPSLLSWKGQTIGVLLSPTKCASSFCF